MSQVKNPPLVMAGLSLGLFALGNLLESYLPMFRYLLGTVAVLLYLLLIVGMVRHPRSCREQLAQPLVGSVFPTFFMQGMILAGYLTLFAGLGSWVLVISKLIWWLSFLGLIALMLAFSWHYLLRFDLKNVFPSWTVLYVGIGVASLTAPVSGQYGIGQAVFWYGLVATLCVLPLVLYKTYQIGLPDGVKPNTTTICAPMSLITAGYVNSFAEPSRGLLITLIIAAQLLYLFIVLQLPSLMKRDFSPGFSAFTFPLVISATSLKLSLGVLGVSGLWQGLAYLETLIATVVVAYVLVGYVRFLRRSV